MTEPRRDRWGRYLLPDPETGEERAWTRATTWANTLSDPWGLVDWKLRMAVKGVATREDLRALASSLPLDSGKKQLNEVARDAIEYAGGSSGRNLGTALHEWTAQADRGGDPDVPAPWNRDLEAYHATLERYGVWTIAGLVERIVCVPELGVAGTFDRIVGWAPGSYIADVKTAASLEYAWTEIAIQLAIYSRATHLWDARAEAWRDSVPVNQEQGLVIHLPVGQARCDLYWVDLVAGWEAAEFAGWVRDWRKRSNLARPFGVDLLGRSPVQPVLDMESPAAATAPGPVTPSADGSDSAHETEGAGQGERRVESPAAADRPEREPAPAGDEPGDPGPIQTVRLMEKT